ncbi:purine-nucleoside phosphorylase [Vulgatibacter incomptus]|uniref:Purine nucleoside phosphorylase n=1 Tax=Vulgatibacter incomptus TaxID=1391653 RepID=A0A0K1PB01_9BACT|nr:purine-nucleoside phosphorylase [Vulgatibacter incomptus]AKU90294.1 Purine nucleoside phosphorylase [Vulgatibacter incomptus]
MSPIPTDHFERLAAAAALIRERSGMSPEVGVILGSGLGGFGDRLEAAVTIPYGALPGFPASSVLGHRGRLLVGKLGGTTVAALQGRAHGYEGFEPWQLAFPTRALCLAGIRTLVVTNAAGGIRADLRPGDLMRISDHIDLSGTNPLVGPNDDRLGTRFPDLSRAYDSDLTAKLYAAARGAGVELKTGVYACMRGPSYETPAEIKMLRTLGADAVGMSTVPEVIAAVHMGVRIAGISCITNFAAGASREPLRHDEVAVVAAKAADRFSALLEAFLPAAAS